jgi:hypothetical protein
MSGFEFQEPGSMEYINPDACAGQLLIIWPIQHVNPAPPTKFSRPDKIDDAISVDIVTLDQLDENGKPKVFRSQLWRQSRLIQSFRQRIGGDPLLGTIGKGTATMGQPPWIFISLTHEPAAVERANAWGAANPGFKASEPREYVVTPPAQNGASNQQYGQQPRSQQPYGQQQESWHGAPQDQPQWSQPQPQPQYGQPQYQQQPAQPQPQYQQQGAPQQQTPPLPPNQQQPQGADPAQQSILQRLAQQHGNNPHLQGEQAQQQYGY